MNQQNQIRKRREEMAALMPFADAICGFDNDLRHRTFIEGSKAAMQLTAIADQIAKLTVDVRDKRLTAAPVTGRRASQATDSLRQTLVRWHNFYNRYDPEFTWWVAEPFKRAETALTGYQGVLSEVIAGVKPDDKETIVGDPVGRDALVKALQAQFIAYTPEELIANARRELACANVR